MLRHAVVASAAALLILTTTAGDLHASHGYDRLLLLSSDAYRHVIEDGDVLLFVAYVAREAEVSPEEVGYGRTGAIITAVNDDTTIRTQNLPSDAYGVAAIYRPTDLASEIPWADSEVSTCIASSPTIIEDQEGSCRTPVWHATANHEETVDELGPRLRRVMELLEREDPSDTEFVTGNGIAFAGSQVIAAAMPALIDIVPEAFATAVLQPEFVDEVPDAPVVEGAAGWAVQTYEVSGREYALDAPHAWPDDTHIVVRVDGVVAPFTFAPPATVTLTAEPSGDHIAVWYRARGVGGIAASESWSAPDTYQLSSPHRYPVATAMSVLIDGQVIDSDQWAYVPPDTVTITPAPAAGSIVEVRYERAAARSIGAEVGEIGALFGMPRAAAAVVLVGALMAGAIAVTRRVGASPVVALLAAGSVLVWCGRIDLISYPVAAGIILVPVLPAAGLLIRRIVPTG